MQSVALVENADAPLLVAATFGGTEDHGIVSALMAAISDLVENTGRNKPTGSERLLDVVEAVISRHLGQYLSEIASRRETPGQYEQFIARDARASQEQKTCLVWLALTVIDGHAARIADANGLHWTYGVLADQYCPNPPTVQQVLNCRQLPLSDDRAKLYGLAQQVYGSFERYAKSVVKSSGRDVVLATGQARLSACFPSYIRDFNGVVSLPLSSPRSTSPANLLSSSETCPRRPGILQQSLWVCAIVMLCLFAGFFLGWIYQGQMFTDMTPDIITQALA